MPKGSWGNVTVPVDVKINKPFGEHWYDIIHPAIRIAVALHFVVLIVLEVVVWSNFGSLVAVVFLAVVSVVWVVVTKNYIEREEEKIQARIIQSQPRQAPFRPPTPPAGPRGPMTGEDE